MLGGRNAEDYDGVQISVRWDMCATECIVCLPDPWPLNLSFFLDWANVLLPQEAKLSKSARLASARPPQKTPSVPTEAAELLGAAAWAPMCLISGESLHCFVVGCNKVML